MVCYFFESRLFYSFAFLLLRKEEEMIAIFPLQPLNHKNS